MVIKSKYGITLSRLTYDDIELVRKWRNSPEISQFMEFRDHITPAMQEKWFASLDDKTNFFFIPIYKNEKIGLVDIKKIDWVEKIGEAGIFIYSIELQNSLIPLAVNMSALDFDFYELGLRLIKAHVLKSNKRAIKFNKAFGFELQGDQENVNNQLYLLNKNNYEKHTERFKKILIRSMKG